MDPVGYELRTNVHGKGDGVFATRNFSIGDTVILGVIESRLECNDSHATQVSLTEFVRHADMGPKANHSCGPNCGMRINDTGAFDFIARKTIVKGDEITFDYAMRNYSIEYFPNRCLCGSEQCRGHITGWKNLPDERKKEYEGLVAPYLLEADEAQAQAFEERYALRETRAKEAQAAEREGACESDQRRREREHSNA